MSHRGVPTMRPEPNSQLGPAILATCIAHYTRPHISPPPQPPPSPPKTSPTPEHRQGVQEDGDG
ncbi:hypothetical protein Hypma_004195 [Hypsizygus marmoreus]|uniref:Uncharacterized protein n=1 Tax=Hypsizygus marmoreus TaxID=39966 RepID=A0A369J1Z9_HYPMA|nr:hypothetical protein Hypma_004195 [Hypsizygus marmoreus]